jgi:hypothetical protein
MTSDERAALRRRIEREHGSIHRFCKRTGCGRTTVYWLVAGRYPGNEARQLARLEAALEGADREELAYRAIRGVACGRCATRNSDLCRRCERMHRDQARAVVEVISQVE